MAICICQFWIYWHIWYISDHEQNKWDSNEITSKTHWKKYFWEKIICSDTFDQTMVLIKRTNESKHFMRYQSWADSQLNISSAADLDLTTVAALANLRSSTQQFQLFWASFYFNLLGMQHFWPAKRYVSQLLNQVLKQKWQRHLD